MTSSEQSPSVARGPALLRLGFRPFYLLAALLAALGVPLWLAQYSQLLAPAGYLTGVLWHAHEMVFGFAAAVITGFLFTAARNWTGFPTPTGWRLAGLAGVWLAARVLVATGPAIPAALADLMFLPLVALALWFPLRRSGNRNLFFVALILLFALANLGFHCARLGIVPVPALLPARAALYLVVFIVALMSGRVIPAFTRNALPRAQVHISPRFDRAALALLAAALLLALLQGPGGLLALCALAGALMHGYRLWRWDPLATRRQPILWILHLSYAWIPVGLLLLAGNALDVRVPAVLADHALGVGAVGGMIIGMITRTARGHTGRPLEVGAAETAAYVLVHLAALARVVPGLIWAPAYLPGLVLSASLWSTAFAVYAVVYWPILSQPRADGKPE